MADRQQAQPFGDERFRSAFETAGHGMAIVGLDGRFLEVNDVWTEIVGYSRQDLLALDFRSITHPDDLALDVAHIKELLAGRSRSFASEERYVRKDGQIVWIQLNIGLIRDPAGKPLCFVSQIQDITERKKLQAQLELLATRDELTGAYNRRSLLNQAEVEMRRARRFKRPLAFLFLDIDHFKQINDRYGHRIGDGVLATLAEICGKVLRPSDIFARYGGEEFVIMLPETGMDQATVVALRLAEQVRRAELIATAPDRRLTLSIGVSALRGEEDTIEAVLDRIDKAMYRAKDLGRDRIETQP